MESADVYLDNNATTRPLPVVVEAMLPFLSDTFANPSSRYPAANVARRAIEEARAVVANFIRARSPSQIVFTSGGTESIGFALSSGTWAPRQIVVGATEHAAVHAAAARWSREQPVRLASVDRSGRLDLKRLEADISGLPSLVSIGHANNETGVIEDVAEVARICRKQGALLHCDAIQSPGKLEIDVVGFGCDFLSLSAHKFHGPKGTGVLYVRDPTRARALVSGHQESGLRGGTENVAGIAGTAAALNALSNLGAHLAAMAHRRDQLETALLAAVPGSAVNGAGVERVCNTTNIFFPHRDAADLVEQLGSHGIYVSAGAACTTGGEPSHVIRAMGYDRNRANASLRFSLSRFTTDEDIMTAAHAVADVYDRALPTYGDHEFA